MSSSAEQPTGTAGFKEQLFSFNRTFWIANTMEMLERLAYYGLRTVLPIYMVLSIAQGGPEFNHIQKGTIYAAWAAVQSGLPIITGGFADRYGYKLTVGISVAIKVLGYLTMAFALSLGELSSGGVNVTVPGHEHTYLWFTMGALLLAAGTAVFKPGLQGIIAHQINDENASVGWALFYQLVNIGGFLGPFLAGWLRLLDWQYVFIACALIVSLNYLLLLTFAEPSQGHDETEPAAHGVFAKAAGVCRVVMDSIMGILEPKLLAFLVIFSGFWMMFHQLFDLLPNYIADWVDSRMVVDTLMRPLFALFGSEVPVEWAGHLPQEFMINVNAGMCMLLAFVVGYYTGKVRSMTAMIAGIAVSAAAIWALGFSANGWVTILAIMLFSLGELSASPTKMRYFASIAPPSKKGLYLGYINATGGIGWSLGSMIAGQVYEAHGDKVVLGRRYLVEHQVDPAVVSGLAKDDVLPRVGELVGADADGVREVLMAAYHPDSVWLGFALIGLASMFGLIAYDRITRAQFDFKKECALLISLTGGLAFVSYGLIVAALYFDMDPGTLGFGAAWAIVFSGGMCIWLVEFSQGRTVGRTTLTAAFVVGLGFAWAFGWTLMSWTLVILIAIGLVDLYAGRRWSWEPTAV